MSELLTIGEPLAVFCSTQPDVALEDVTDFKRVIGGAELNVAIGTHRLGHSVEYVSGVGTDPLGKAVVKAIRQHGIGTKYINVDDRYLTGHQIKQLVTTGDPFVANYRRDSAASHLTSSLIDQIDLSDVKIVHVTGIFPAISSTAEQTTRTLMQRAQEARVPITFDTNLRPALWADRDQMIKTINELAAKATVVLPGINEGKVLMGSDDPEAIADFYLQNEPTQAVIVKVGPKGAFVKEKGQAGKLVPGFKVEHVVDTVGAGDGFALGVITSLLEGQSYQAAAKRGNAVGALQVQAPGDNDGYPDPKQLKEFFEKN